MQSRAFIVALEKRERIFNVEENLAGCAMSIDAQNVQN